VSSRCSVSFRFGVKVTRSFYGRDFRERNCTEVIRLPFYFNSFVNICSRWTIFYDLPPWITILIALCTKLSPSNEQVDELDSAELGCWVVSTVAGQRSPHFEPLLVPYQIST
jgi:hypothetical protein